MILFQIPLNIERKAMDEMKTAEENGTFSYQPNVSINNVEFIPTETSQLRQSQPILGQKPRNWCGTVVPGREEEDVEVSFFFLF